MGVLYAVRYAHSASGNFSFHPLPISFTVFCRIFLICVLDVSAWPLVWGWYGVAMLCLVPSSLRKFRKAESMKCDPPSLITIRGVPNLGKIISWNILRYALHLRLCMAWLRPIWRRNLRRPEYTRILGILQKVPCNLYPRHQKVQLEDCSLGALNRELWFIHASGSLDIFGWSSLYLHT